MSTEILFQELKHIFDTHAILCDEPMANHTTFNVGGPADYLVRPQNAEEIHGAIEADKEASMPWWVIAAEVTCLYPMKASRVVIEIGDALSDITIEGSTIIAQAGATNEAVAKAACAAGLAGYEFASGIPDLSVVLPL